MTLIEQIYTDKINKISDNQLYPCYQCSIFICVYPISYSDSHRFFDYYKPTL